MDKIARYEEIERRGLLDKLPQDKQALWAEYRRRNPVKEEPSKLDNAVGQLKEDVSTISMPLETALQGATLGGYGWLADEVGLDYSGRRKQYEEETGTLGKGGLMASEIAGNIAFPAKAIVGGLGKLGLKGAAKLAAAGAIEGGTYGLTGSKGDVGEAFGGAIVGGALGGAVPAVATGAGKVVGKIADTGAELLKKVTKTNTDEVIFDKSLQLLKDQVGAESFEKLLSEANKKGRSILEVGDDNVVGYAKNILANSPNARARFTQTAKELADKRKVEARKIINDVLGSKDMFESADAVNDMYIAKAKPIYNKLNKVDSIPEVGNLIKGNETIRNTVNAIKSNYPELSALKDDSFEVVNEARKIISKQARSLDTTQAHFAGETLKKLDDALAKSSIADDYSKARRLYSDEYAIKDATKEGFEFLNTNKLVGQLKKDVAKMGEAEKQGLAVGVRERLMNEIGKFTNENQALKKLLPENTQEKLTAMLGKDKAKKLLDYASDEFKSQQNLNNLLRQSQTAELQAMQRKPLFDDLMARYGDKGIVGTGLQLGRDIGSAISGNSLNKKYGIATEALIDPNIAESFNRFNRNIATPQINLPSEIINQRVQELLKNVGG